MNLSEKLIHLRKNKKLSQLQLAEILSVSRQAISKWESGNTMPDITNLIELGKFYNVSIDYLLDNNFTEEKNNRSTISLMNISYEKVLMRIMLLIMSLGVGFILGVIYQIIT